MKKWIHVIWQVLILHVFLWLGILIVSWIEIQFPGSIVGMLMLLGCLYLGWMKIEWVELGARWLLAEMVLFFIPSAIGIIQYPSLLSWDGFHVVGIILIGTSAVMLVTGWIGDWLTFRKQEVKSGDSMDMDDDHDFGVSH